MGLDVSVILPTYNEEGNIETVIEGVKKILNKLKCSFNIIVADAGSWDNTRQIAHSLGAEVFIQKERGYGAALREAFQRARGKYIITMDCDFSHDPIFIADIFNKRHEAEVVIASRYIKGGKSDTSLYRKFLSIIFNKFCGVVLSLPFYDLSSGFRLYHRRALMDISISSVDFDILEEVLIKLFMNGWKIIEVPFHYKCRNLGKSNMHASRLFIVYTKTIFKMWKQRNSVFSSDYDERGFNSKIPIQRYWHRRRYNIIRSFHETKGKVLDIGCGSSRITQDIPNILGLDIDLKKLRYLRDRIKWFVEGDIFSLPFHNASFDEIICSEVIEHVPKEKLIFEEFNRILKENGILIVGTPDYGRPYWPFFENFIYKRFAPGAYAVQHISHYTFQELSESLRKANFEIIEWKYILKGELILKCKKLKMD